MYIERSRRRTPVPVIYVVPRVDDCWRRCVMIAVYVVVVLVGVLFGAFSVLSPEGEI
jgi:hypothetical protein